MRTIDPATELPEDPLLRWAARDPGRAWVSDDGRAFAVAGACLSRHDRLAVCGPAESLAPLVEKALAEVGPTYRPLGDRPVIAALTAGLPRLRVRGEFGWMDRSDGPAPAPAAAVDATPPAGSAPWRARWLAPAEEPEAAELLRRSHPSSYAVPGGPGVERWAGVRDDAGRLVAVGAHAWSAPGVGFLAGIAVDGSARGRGLGRTVFGFVLDEALAAHRTVALMVDDDNAAAIALYRSRGLTYRAVSAASVLD